MFIHKHDKGLALTPSCYEINIGLRENKEMLATCDVTTSSAEDSGPLCCAAGLIISPTFMSKTESLRIQ